MAITIKKVSTKRELKKLYPFQLQNVQGQSVLSSPTFTTICSIHLTSVRNAAFEFCEADYFLAYQDDKIVGRVAAIINQPCQREMGLQERPFQSG